MTYQLARKWLYVYSNLRNICGRSHGYEFHSRKNISTKSTKTDIVGYLQSKIKFSGPITISEYMKEVLTNPIYGYYMHRDVFGQKGDFTTSPEISQMFGELIGVWMLNEWMLAGSPSKLHVVELGPGRGTLADDVLRVFSKFGHLVKDVSLHLVEVSPKMRQLQRDKLLGLQDARQTTEVDTQENDTSSSSDVVSRFGIPVTWHNNLENVPKGFCCFVAHEFLDALPIHSFQRTTRGWREILVDVDEVGGPHHFRFVLSPTPTAPSALYVQETETRNHIEVCPESGIIIQELARRIMEHGGSALIADYGHDGTKSDTLRGFKDHRLHEVLCEPGTADLTADVDFSYVRRMAGERVDTFGPVTQHYYLKNMGIDTRMKALMINASAQQQSSLVSGYKMLTDPKQMGELFKFFAIKQSSVRSNPTADTPAGFARLTGEG